MEDIPHYESVAKTVQEIKGRIGLIVLQGITNCWACNMDLPPHDFHPKCVARHWGPIFISLIRPEKSFQGTLSYFGLELSFDWIMTMEDQSYGFCAIDYAFGKMMAEKSTYSFWPCLFNYCVIASQMRQTRLKTMVVNTLLCIETLSYTEFGNGNRFPMPLIVADIYSQSLRSHILYKTKEEIRHVFELIRVRLYQEERHEWVNLLNDIMLQQMMATVNLSDSHCPGTGV